MNLTSINLPTLSEPVPHLPRHYLRRQASNASTIPTPQGSGTFDITYTFETDVLPALRTMFATAALRWGGIITTKHIPLHGIGTRPICGTTRTVPDFTDMMVFVAVRKIDGVGGTLGSANPCLAFQNYPRIGEMILDIDDVTPFITSHPDVMLNVVIHELGHILGIGTMWDTFHLVAGNITTNPVYLGIHGNDALQYVNNTNGIPNILIETLGGIGTALVHWQEQTYGNELMTGFLGFGEQPLSRISVQSLMDLNYAVDVSAADAYSIPTDNGTSSSTTAFIDLTPPNTPTVSGNEFTLPPGFANISTAADSGVLWIAIVAAVGGLLLLLITYSLLFRKRREHVSAMYVVATTPPHGHKNAPHTTFDYTTTSTNGTTDCTVIDDLTLTNTEWTCPKCTLMTVGLRCEACDCAYPHGKSGTIGVV